MERGLSDLVGHACLIQGLDLGLKYLLQCMCCSFIVITCKYCLLKSVYKFYVSLVDGGFSYKPHLMWCVVAGLLTSCLASSASLTPSLNDVRHFMPPLKKLCI